ALPISQGQKSFVRDLVVFDGVDAYLGHLHSFFRILIGSVDIKSNYEGITCYKRTAHLGVMHLHVLFPPIGFTSYLIDPSHFRRHVFHRAGFNADDISRIKIVDRLLPVLPLAKLHQSHRNVFRTHISSIVLVYFRYRNSFFSLSVCANSAHRWHDPLSPELFCFRMWLYHSKDVASGIFSVGQPANTGDLHLRHTNLTAALLNFLYRLIE